MAMTLDILGDKVDTELPLMPLHRVSSCMFEQKEDEEGEEEAEEEAEEQATARQVRITRAMMGEFWRLTVQVTEIARDNHREVIQTIYNDMMQDMPINCTGASFADEEGHFIVMALR